MFPELTTRLQALFSQVGLHSSNLLHAGLTCSHEDSEKSTTQKAGDTFRSGADDTQSSGKGYVESAQDTLGNVAGVASDKIKGAGKLLRCKFV